MLIPSSSFAARGFGAMLLLAGADALACSGRLHIEIKDSGVYALDYAAIVSAQPDLADCKADDLVLTSRDTEVPMRVTDDGNGRFRPGGRVEWLGEASHGPQSWFDQYSNVNVYLLAAAPGVHARVREAPAPARGTPAALRRRLHFEQENLMIRLGDTEMKHGDEPDVWQWAKLTPIDAQPFAFDFNLPDADASGGRAADVAVTLDFRGESNVAAAPKPVDHAVEVTVNGVPVQTLEWDGRAEIRRTLNIPRSQIKPSGNRLQLRVPRRDMPGNAQNFIIDVVMFNWAEVDYPIRGDVDVGAAAFRAGANAPIEFMHSGAGVAALLGSDGLLRAGAPLGNGRFRAAGATENVDLYPFAGTALKPLLVRAVAAGDLRAAAPGYDYLMVTHPRLRAAIEPLAQYHREHGLKVGVIDVNDIYDQFGGGLVHPAAIRDLIAWGVAHWQTKPRYVLLVGDASLDIHHDIRNVQRLSTTSFAPNANLQPDEVMVPGGFIGMGATEYAHWDPELPHRNLIPTWQVPSSSQGQSASDNPFVAIKSDDYHPQLAIGRFPVVQPAEVKAIVDKTLAYLSNPAPGRWHRDVTFISSSEVSAFKDESDHMALELERAGYAVNSFYTDFNDTDPAHVNAVRTSLKRNLDEGSLLVHFMGHGGSYIWRVGPMGDLVALDDVAAMKNAGRYPMVLAMTCFSAPFDNPVDDSIGERFLREGDKGAVAVFGASWSNFPSPAYSKDLIDLLLQPGRSIGEAVVAAKAKTADRTFVEMYNLLGDPAVHLARPRTQLKIQPMSGVWETRLAVQVPAADFGGTVDVDWTDAHGQILASRHYEARDRLFYLPLLDRTGQVLVYTADTRNGSTAFGSYAVLQAVKAPAVPAKAPEAAASQPVDPVASPPPVAVPAAMVPVNAPDRISRLGFDAQAPAAEKLRAVSRR